VHFRTLGVELGNGDEVLLVDILVACGLLLAPIFYYG